MRRFPSLRLARRCLQSLTLATVFLHVCSVERALGEESDRRTERPSLSPHRLACSFSSSLSRFALSLDIAMSTSIAPQAPVVGSLFPDWEAKTFLEIHFRSLGCASFSLSLSLAPQPLSQLTLCPLTVAQGFSVAWDDTAPKGVHTFYCAETPTAAGYDSCPCAWTIACDAETGAFQTTSAAFEHAHLEVPADSEGRRETVKEHREFLAEAVDDLEEKATARFDQLRKLSSYRIGLESLTGPSHSVQQQVIVWDLADGVGRKRAREFERKMRLEDHLADDYPVRDAHRNSITRSSCC